MRRNLDQRSYRFHKHTLSGLETLYTVKTKEAEDYGLASTSRTSITEEAVHDYYLKTIGETGADQIDPHTKPPSKALLL